MLTVLGKVRTNHLVDLSRDAAQRSFKLPWDSRTVGIGQEDVVDGLNQHCPVPSSMRCLTFEAAETLLHDFGV
jgi:hypothetical protein